MSLQESKIPQQNLHLAQLNPIILQQKPSSQASMMTPLPSDEETNHPNVCEKGATQRPAQISLSINNWCASPLLLLVIPIRTQTLVLKFKFQMSIQHVATETLRSVPICRDPRICICCSRKQPIRVKWCPTVHGVDTSNEDHRSLLCL
jgi:hypothetical protein